jgi:hypothetical protein
MTRRANITRRAIILKYLLEDLLLATHRYLVRFAHWKERL